MVDFPRNPLKVPDPESCATTLPFPPLCRETYRAWSKDENLLNEMVAPESCAVAPATDFSQGGCPYSDRIANTR